MPPVKPMLAKSVPELPRGDGLAYEPKWDGFRCIVFRDGDEIELGSRNDKPLTRYFPEVVELLREALPPRCVVDGEIVLVTPDGLSFDTLQLRLHPAASRVRKLSVETPASFVAFDLLACGDRDVTGSTPPRAAGGAGRGRHRGAGRVPDTVHDGPRGGAGLVHPVRGRGLRRRDGEAPGRRLRAGQARDVEGEARAHGRLRGRGLPAAQGRRDGRLARARALPGRRAAQRGRGQQFHRGHGARSSSTS